MTTPKVYLVGYTGLDFTGLRAFLEDTNNKEFWKLVDQALEQGLSEAEILCSIMAKLCYRSLKVGDNINISKTRDIWDNIVATLESGHLSVFEHISFNFIVTGCSRVFTHELVRHRTGTAFSQTSGRYCRYEDIDIVRDPILSPCDHIIDSTLSGIEDAAYLMECKLGLRVPCEVYPDAPPTLWLESGCEYGQWVPNTKMSFDTKKKLTSAVRRIIPQGIVNEIGFTCNLRALRHIVMLRTAPGAEWEIREIVAQMYELVKGKFPLAFYGAIETVVDGITSVTGLSK